ncbi:CpaD family pilus assembly protein [Novosphingobium soli]|uniref:CpaD family pilus assembly protein n=1 Tax=Novosphingobium soli TaxID=574956 RepID=A0ABV6CXI2_9SPHN
MRKQTLALAALALGTAAALSGCGGVPSNRSMYSVHQPVVEKVDYALDVTTGGAGLAYGEQARLAAWFKAMGLKYGEKVYVDDPEASAATRAEVEAVASRYGILLSDSAPQTAGALAGGTARVILTRTTASVPGCPDWSAKSDFNPGNAISTNYGCAVNANLAAMVADPEDLLHGATPTDPTIVTDPNRAINAYRAAGTTGKGNTVTATPTGGN